MQTLCGLRFFDPGGEAVLLVAKEKQKSVKVHRTEIFEVEEQE